MANTQKIELYEGHIYETPPIPPNYLIDNFDIIQKNQKWRRRELPEEFNFWEKEAQEEYVSNEFIRRREGYWFYNNGVPTYITGHHYFYLQWCRYNFDPENPYPQYRDVDRRAFYFWDLCEKNPNCIGEIQLKFRRRGSTSQGLAIGLNTGLLNKNIWCGLLSKTGRDAKECFDGVVDILRNLPSFFIPLIDGKDRPKNELLFARPSTTLSVKKAKINRGIELNTRINYRSTVKNAYDGKKLKWAMFDEGGKWPVDSDSNFTETWDIHKPCFMVGKNIIGKAYLPSTVNEMERGGGRQFKDVWNNSDPNNKDPNGRTISGLYRYFVPAYDGLEGFIDEYGMSMTEEARLFLENEREALKNDKNRLSEKKRQYPFTAEEAFRGESKHSPYDIEKINEQLEHNSSFKNIVSRGNFIWGGGLKDTKVVFQHDKNGKWLVTWMPKGETQNLFSQKGGKRFPGNTHVGCFGVDPFDHKLTTANTRSNGASYGYKKTDPLSPIDSNIFVTEYINRPPTPEIFYEDMILQCVFYGWQILPETNKIGLVRYFENRGYDNYIMDRPQETHTDYSHTRQREKGVPMSPAVQTALVSITQSYIYANVGWIEEEGKEPRMGKCYFDNLLKDWMDFDPNMDWTPRDAMVAAGLALLGSTNIKITIEKKKPVVMFAMYDNRGIESREIKY